MPPDVDRALAQLEADLRQLEADYNAFFAGRAIAVFAWTFVLLQAAMFVLMSLWLLERAAQQGLGDSGFFRGTFWWLFAIAAVLVIPLRAEPKAPEFRINQPVRVLSLGNDGVLLSDPANRGRPAEVMVGTMRLKVKWDQLEPKASAAPSAGSKQVYLTTEDASLSPEIQLLGKTVEEAMDLLAPVIADRGAEDGLADDLSELFVFA